MLIMMVNILLQVLSDALRATRGEYSQARPNIGGNQPERSRLQNPIRLSSRTYTSGLSWPKRIKALGSFVQQLRAETQNHMGSVMHRAQSREDDLQSHRSQSITSHGIKSIDDTEWMGASDTWNQPSTKVYYLYEHGMINSLHIKSID